MMEQSHAGEGHDHVLLIALFDHQIIPDGAAGFCDVLDTGGEGTLDVVAEGEECIAAQRYIAAGGQPRLLFTLGQALRLLSEVILPDALKDDRHIDLKEVVLMKHSPRNGLLIRELDISRQTIIVMVKRNGTMLVPKGDLMLLEGDRVILYSQERISHASTIQV